MRNKTRFYTTDLPHIDLQFLAELRRLHADAEPGTTSYCRIPGGTLHASQQADGYVATINGVTLKLRITTTLAGYGIRHWYICPRCMKRVAKLHIGKKDIACRECCKLQYISQSQRSIERVYRNIRRQRFAMWGNYEPANDLFNNACCFPKPKGMRWATYIRKLDRLVTSENMYWKALTPIAERLDRRT